MFKNYLKNDFISLFLLGSLRTPNLQKKVSVSAAVQIARYDNLYTATNGNQPAKTIGSGTE